MCHDDSFFHKYMSETISLGDLGRNESLHLMIAGIAEYGYQSIQLREKQFSAHEIVASCSESVGKSVSTRFW